MSRKRIFEIIETADEGDSVSRAYDIFMLIVIVASLVPLTIKTNDANRTVLTVIDMMTAVIFVIDYILRWITADYKIQQKKASFALYPFKIMAIFDLLSILPSFLPINGAFRLLKVIRLARLLRVFRFIRYSKNIQLLIRVIRKQKEALLAVVALAFGYILITALILFNVEPSTFDNFFDAVYWATISLTSVGYGDLYATSDLGRAFEMISAIFGIAVVALPSGVITAGFMTELQGKKNSDEDNQSN